MASFPGVVYKRSLWPKTWAEQVDAALRMYIPATNIGKRRAADSERSNLGGWQNAVGLYIIDLLQEKGYFHECIIARIFQANLQMIIREKEARQGQSKAPSITAYI